MSRIFTIAGVRDGLGTTTLATNLACALQRSGPTLLINLSHDGDASFAFGLNGSVKRLGEVSEMLKKISPAIIEGVLKVPLKNVSLIESGEKADAHGLASCLDGLKDIYGTIVIDAGDVCDDATIEAFRRSERVLAVTSSSLPVICDTEALLKRFVRAFYPMDRVLLVAARWEEGGNVPRSCILDKTGQACRFFIESDRSVFASVQRGVPIIMEEPKAQASSAFALIAEELLNSKKTDVLSGVNWDVFLPAKGAAERTKAGVRIEEKNEKPEQERETALPPESIPVKQEVLDSLLDAAEMKDMRPGALYKKTESVILDVISRMDGARLNGLDRTILVKEILDEALGLGPLEGLLSDGSVSEIMVNSSDRIYVERNGKLILTDKRFTSEHQLLRVIERIVAPIGRRIDESSPMVDARLMDGSRVNMIIPPVSLRGPSITIRKFSARPLKIDDLVRHDSLTGQMAKFLEGCVKGRLNILVSGGTGSGKTTLLNVLSSFIPNDERIVTIEDAAELNLGQEHVVRLESRPPNIEGKGAVTIRDLVKNALRMRPDRIVVGECRGGEALDMLQAMNTGHDGSLTTIHANSPRDSIARLETLVMFAGMELPSKAIREQIAAAIHLVVQLTRLSDGTRKIVQISEVSGMEGDKLTMQDLFVFEQGGATKEGKVIGDFVSTGFRPKFADSFRAKGIELW